jgi:hypothetical protein
MELIKETPKFRIGAIQIRQGMFKCVCGDVYKLPIVVGEESLHCGCLGDADSSMEKKYRKNKVKR